MLKENNIKFYILGEILRNYSDEENILTLKEINKYMTEKNIEEIKDLRTLNRYIENLQYVGFDIQEGTKDKSKGYYVASREFEPHEIRILSDCVRSSKFISKDKSKDLIEKLNTYNNQFNQYSITKHSYIDDRPKTTNEQVFYNIDKLERALAEEKKISFNYYEYSEKKELVKKKDENNQDKKYIVNPLGMILQRDKYYLVGDSNFREGIIINYRIDKIKNMEVLKDEIENLSHIDECRDKFNITKYAKKCFKMNPGKETKNIVLEVKKSTIGAFIDELGQDINIEPIIKDDDNKEIEYDYKIEFEVSISPGVIKWLLQFGSSVKVISPQCLVEDIKKEIDKLSKLYN